MRTFALKAGLAAAFLSLSVAGALAGSSSLTELQREALENHGLIDPSISDQAAPTHGSSAHAMHQVRPSMGRTMTPPYPGEPRLG